MENPKAHGLGFLHPPKDGFDDRADAPVWVNEAWDWILRDVLDLPRSDPSCFDLPAMMRFKITTPEVLKVLQARQMSLPYRDRVKPFNFMLSPMIDDVGDIQSGAILIDLLSSSRLPPDSSRWYSLQYVNVHDGRRYRLGRP